MTGEERSTHQLFWYGVWKQYDANFLVKIGSALGRSEIWLSSIIFLLLRTVDRIAKPWKSLNKYLLFRGTMTTKDSD